MASAGNAEKKSSTTGISKFDPLLFLLAGTSNMTGATGEWVLDVYFKGVCVRKYTIHSHTTAKTCK